MDILATLVNIGAAGAVIAVVIVFLQFIKERDQNWQSFFQSIRASDQDAVEASRQLAAVIEKLVERVERLDSKFDSHNHVEMEYLHKLDSRKKKMVPYDE